MKKTLALLLVMILCFCMTGCSTIAVIALNMATEPTTEEISSVEEEIFTEQEETVEEYPADEYENEYIEEELPAEPMPEALPEENADEPSEPTSEPVPSDTPAIEDLVYTAYEVPLKGEDSVGNTYNLTYRIPAFNLDTEEAQAANEYLEQWLLPYVEDQLACHEAGDSIMIHQIDYATWVSHDILTVLVVVDTDWSQVYYQVYNLDLHTGEFLENADILAVLGLTEDMYWEALFLAIESMYDFEGAEELGLEFIQEQLMSTLSEENLSSAVLFLDEDGRLMLHVTIYPLAGPSTYETIIELPIL